MKIPKVILRIETSRACGRGILIGISKYCRLLSRWRLSQSLPYYLDSGSSIDELNMPENWMADGVIIDRPDIPEAVQKSGLPIIVMDILKPVVGMPNIVGDNDRIAEIALEHFTGRGFSQLAYCKFDGVSWAQIRGESFAACASNAGIDIAKYSIKNARGRFSWDDEVCSIGSWLSNLPHPLGLLACNDDCAKLVSAACESAGILVPDHVAILGVDNDQMICLPNDPPLSSITLDFEKAGFEAASLLDRIMKGQEALASQRIIIHPTCVVSRQSTDTLAVSDPEIVSALRFIRNNVHKHFGVPDVVKAAAISRRGLEYRFKKVLGRSINHVVKGFRIEQISKMLVETNLPITQIAHELGFTSSEHIARYFRNEKQISPSEFRAKYGNL